MAEDKPSASTLYLNSFFENYHHAQDTVHDIDGSIVHLKRAQMRLGSYLSVGGELEPLLEGLGITTDPSAAEVESFLRMVEREHLLEKKLKELNNQKLVMLLEQIRACRAEASQAPDPQRAQYWNIKAEMFTLIHGFLRDRVYP